MTNEELIEKYQRHLTVSEAIYKKDGVLSFSMSADAKYDDDTKLLVAETLERIDKIIPKEARDGKYGSEMHELRKWLKEVITVLSGELLQLGGYGKRIDPDPIDYGYQILPQPIRINTKELMQEVFEETVETLLNNIKETYRYEGIDVETGNEYEHWDDL